MTDTPHPVDVEGLLRVAEEEAKRPGALILDPAAVAALCREVLALRAERDRARQTACDLERECGLLEQKVSRREDTIASLRAALTPFARYGDTLPPTASDSWPMDDAGSREGRGDMPTVGDCRAARQVLEGGAS